MLFTDLSLQSPHEAMRMNAHSPFSSRVSEASSPVPTITGLLLTRATHFEHRTTQMNITYFLWCEFSSDIQPAQMPKHQSHFKEQEKISLLLLEMFYKFFYIYIYFYIFILFYSFFINFFVYFIFFILSSLIPFININQSW